jgi:CRISPR-associated protein Cas2
MIDHWLILYDIADVKRLRKVAKVLEGCAIRVQKSLFEGNWGPDFAKQVAFDIEQIIDPSCDYVLFFPRCDMDLELVRKVGFGKNIDSEIGPYLVL